MKTKLNESKEAVSKINIKCPINSETKIEMWGQVGHSIGCYKNDILHGKWVAWEDGKIRSVMWFYEGKQCSEDDWIKKQNKVD